MSDVGDAGTSGKNRRGRPQERRGTARALLTLQRRQADTQRVAALGALVGRLAHELGTPLHSVSGHLDLILADPRIPDDLRRRVELISGEVGRLSGLIRRYLNQLRPPEPAPEPTDVVAVVEGVLRVLDPLLTQRRIEIETDLDPAAREPIWCDQGQVEQVVLNLVQNAVDAMPTGGRLVIRVAATERGCAISVCDSGEGVPPEQLDHVFEPFFTTKDASRGSGLGLAICREIARAHRGEIRLDSKPGEGTVVTVTVESLGDAR